LKSAGLSAAKTFDYVTLCIIKKFPRSLSWDAKNPLQIDEIQGEIIRERQSLPFTSKPQRKRSLKWLSAQKSDMIHFASDLHLKEISIKLRPPERELEIT